MVNYKGRFGKIENIVNGISAAATILDFQPATDIQVIITSVGDDSVSSLHVSLYNGTDDSRFFSGLGTANFTTSNMQMFINNTNYLRMYSAGTGKLTSFTGYELP